MSQIISNVGVSPEEYLRQNLYVAIQQYNIDHILDLLVIAFETRVWEKRGVGLSEFFELEFDAGGIGLQRDQLKPILDMKHRRENKGGKQYSEEEARKLKSMKEFFKRELELETIPALSNLGTNRHSRSDISDLEISKTGGTSREYIIALLKRDAPDIAERVINREISAAAGKRELRLRENPDGQPPNRVVLRDVNDVDGVSKALRHHLNRDQIQELVSLLLDEDEA